MTFVHLHCHSEFSLLDGANKLESLVDRSVELGMPALALTDHGNLHGAYHFYETARAKGVKPIIGCEAYVAFGDHRSKEKPPDAPQDYAHLVLLARDLTGYHNLVRLVSIGQAEGFYRRPRIDHKVLEEYAAGLVCLSACMSGELALYLLQDQYEKARSAAEWHARLFGEGYYWLEVQDHGIPGEEKVRDGVFQLANDLGLPILATNDAHYLHRQDADAHDILLCIGTGKDRDDPKRLRFYGQESYFKSTEEMASLFPDRPEVIENTLAVAELCNVEFEEKVHLPEFPRPDDYESEDDLLRKLADSGAKERYGDPLPQKIRERLHYELDVITRTGYSGYFLIVWDFIRAAREAGVPVGPGRGSAAGSLVAYALRITDIDPLRFGLLFERFLNPDRISMPDIDVDFCYERRGEVIEYVRSKYGADSVGQIVTFGTMQARAVVRDVGRTLGFTPAETDRIAKLIPSSPGYSLSVKEAVKRVEELKALYKEEPRYKELLDYAATLEGLSRHTSVHAAGVVIAPGPLAEYVPVMSATTRGLGSDSENGDLVITQYDMVSLEKAGMLKFDFLGLKTLTVISDAAAAVEERHGLAVDWDALGLDDPEVYEMLASGATAGVFQFESSLATEKLRAMRCDRFDDLIAVNALIRPGPLDSGMTDVYIRRKRGAEPVSYPHETLAGVLEPTYGVITYQEQVMRAANELAGFSLAEADVLRKAVGKKDPVLIRQELDRFIGRAVERGVRKRDAEHIASLLETFGRYGFNKAHAAAYAVLSYRTAWLKRHYPAEFMAALLSSEIGNTDKVVGYINQCRSLGLEVMPPHVNESGYKFTVVSDRSIRFGLGAIRGVGRSAIDSIISARRQDGAFISLFDFCSRVDLRLNNKRVIEALIGAGALDGLGSRAAQVEGLEATLREAQLQQRERETGQVSLFGGDAEDGGSREPPLPKIPEWPEADKLAREKELVGFFVSGHPLDAHRDLVELYAQRTNASNLAERRDRKVEIACVVTELSRRISRKDGSEWARLVFEDYNGTATALAFRDAWSKNRETLEPGKPVLLRGSVSGRERDEGDPPLFLDDAIPLEGVYESGRVAVCLELSSSSEFDSERLEQAIKIARAHPGPAPIQVVLRNGSEEHSRLRSRALHVAPVPSVLAELRAVLGEGRVRLVEVARS
ncbi:MAG: DNA polymerase III subunit alpha [Gemmatimonadota bacterium]|nr:MAG: DNA polymerase III subunit alpha [Gemmatimonadota bacterium]